MVVFTVESCSETGILGAVRDLDRVMELLLKLSEFICLIDGVIPFVEPAVVLLVVTVLIGSCSVVGIDVAVGDLDSVMEFEPRFVEFTCRVFGIGVSEGLFVTGVSF